MDGFIRRGGQGGQDWVHSSTESANVEIFAALLLIASTFAKVVTGLARLGDYWGLGENWYWPGAHAQRPCDRRHRGMALA